MSITTKHRATGRRATKGKQRAEAARGAAARKRRTKKARESMRSTSRRSATLLSPERIREYVESMMPSNLHKKRVDSLANATQGVIAAASLSVTAIGSGYAVLNGGDPKHGVKQVDRMRCAPVPGA